MSSVYKHLAECMNFKSLYCGQLDCVHLKVWPAKDFPFIVDADLLLIWVLDPCYWQVESTAEKPIIDI